MAKKNIGTFGMGCFWRPQYMFDRVNGVVKTEVGFMGGNKKNPTYENVCYDLTGHVEVVQITFDPSVISYKELLKIFIDNHDITARHDALSQYTSVIFCHGEEQLKEAREFRLSLSDNLQNKMQTSIEKAAVFYPAEAYHQKYYDKHGGDKLSCN